VHEAQNASTTQRRAAALIPPNIQRPLPPAPRTVECVYVFRSRSPTARTTTIKLYVSYAPIFITPMRKIGSG
jgi:hypothetical protein